MQLLENKLLSLWFCSLLSDNTQDGKIRVLKNFYVVYCGKLEDLANIK